MPHARLKDSLDPLNVTALILAAGSGTRLGGIAKATLEFKGGSLLQHAITLISPFVGHIVVGVRPVDLDWAQEQCGETKTDCSITCVAGGATRQESLERLLAAATTPYVIVHEVARPWVEPQVFRDLLDTLRDCSAVALYTPLPVRDGLALMDNGVLKRSLPRANVVSVQTPQAYRRSSLQRAYEVANRNGWVEESTIALMSRTRCKVRLVEGSPQNVKVTYPEDLAPLRMMSQAIAAKDRQVNG